MRQQDRREVIDPRPTIAMRRNTKAPPPCLEARGSRSEAGGRATFIGAQLL